MRKYSTLFPMKKQRRNKIRAVPFFILLIVAGASAAIGTLFLLRVLLPSTPPVTSPLASLISEPLMQTVQVATPIPTPTPKPTPQPTTYPPKGYHCVNVPILMYHHVQPLEEAATLGHAALTVDRDVFAKQMQYLADRGYTVTTLRVLSDYFDGKATLPKKPIILTFDDAYDDFYTYAVPILASHNFKSDLFVPTGLMENPGYLTWEHVKNSKEQGVEIGHHTWSHANIARNDDTFFHQELDIATQQLVEHGYGPVTVFAYPYGSHNGHDIVELIKRGFTIAVTTLPGNTQCKEDRLALHRTRVGNSSLSAYGL